MPDLPKSGVYRYFALRTFARAIIVAQTVKIAKKGSIWTIRNMKLNNCAMR